MKIHKIKQAGGFKDMIKIEHIAIWTKDLERLKKFYTKYFEAKSNSK